MDLKRAIGSGSVCHPRLGLSERGHRKAPKGGVRSSAEPRPHDVRILVFVIGSPSRGTRREEDAGRPVLFGIVATTVVAMIIQLWLGTRRSGVPPPHPPSCPTSGASAPHFNLLGKFSLTGVWDRAPASPRIAVVLSVMLSDFFDTMVRWSGSPARRPARCERPPSRDQPRAGRRLVAAAAGRRGVRLVQHDVQPRARRSVERQEPGSRLVVVGVLFLLRCSCRPSPG